MSDYQSVDLAERVRARTAQRSAENSPAHQDAPVHPLVEMQRHLGNAQVARMIAQRVEDEEQLQAKHDPSIQRVEDEEQLQAKHDPSIQRVDESGEAEDEEVMAKHDPSIQRVEDEEQLQAKHDPSIQREDESGEAEDEEVMAKHDPSIQRAQEEDELQAKHDLQRKEEQTIGLEGGPVGDDMAGQINSARGGGSSLDSGVRSQVEGALGTDLSGVRVHQDSQSDQLNRSMTAKAFTTGSDIFLRNDVSASDTNLMAHELTHVVQQSSGSVGGSGGMNVGAADDHHEHEADQVAQAVTSGSAQRMREETAAG